MKAKDEEYTSFWFWFFAIFVLAFPCVGFVMTLFWAFSGENESRKNYFRAVIAWQVIALGFWGSILAYGYGPKIMREIHKITQEQAAEHSKHPAD